MTDPAPTNRWAFLRAHGFLVLVSCLVAANVALVAVGGESFVRDLNLMIVLTLLFQHLAIRYARPGRPRRVMQSLAFAWLAATTLLVVLEWTPLMR